jgi:hypothetical protein
VTGFSEVVVDSPGLISCRLLDGVGLTGLVLSAGILLLEDVFLGFMFVDFDDISNGGVAGMGGLTLK